MNIFMAAEYYRIVVATLQQPAPGHGRRYEHPIKMIMPAWLVILSPLQNTCSSITILCRAPTSAAAHITRSQRSRPPGEAIYHFITRGSSVIKGNSKIMFNVRHQWGIFAIVVQPESQPCLPLVCVIQGLP